MACGVDMVDVITCALFPSSMTLRIKSGRVGSKNLQERAGRVGSMGPVPSKISETTRARMLKLKTQLDIVRY